VKPIYTTLLQPQCAFITVYISDACSSCSRLEARRRISHPYQ